MIRQQFFSLAAVMKVELGLDEFFLCFVIPFPGHIYRVLQDGHENLLSLHEVKTGLLYRVPEEPNVRVEHQVDLLQLLMDHVQLPGLPLSLLLTVINGLGQQLLLLPILFLDEFLFFLESCKLGFSISVIVNNLIVV